MVLLVARKSIAHSPHSLNEPRFGWTILYFTTQTINVSVYRVLVGRGCVAPYTMQQLDP